MREIEPTELNNEQAFELPTREAMSLITPTSLPIGTFDPSLIGGGQAMPVDQADPGSSAPQFDGSTGDISQVSPSNQIEASNLDSAGATSTASATQTAPTSGA